MNRSHRAILAVVGCTALLCAACGFEAARQSRNPMRFEADCKLSIDDAAAQDNHVQASDVQSRFKDFVEGHDSFTLSQLQNLKIRNSDGRDVLLQEVASIQVDFRRVGK